MNVLKAQVKVRGLSAIDRRTAAARDLIAWRDELVRDLGGDVSAAQRSLVELATRTRLYVDHLDAFLMAQPRLVDARRRAVFPVLRERQQLVDSLVRLLTSLGLERRALKGRDLSEYVAQRYGATGRPTDHGSEAAEKGAVDRPLPQHGSTVVPASPTKTEGK
ncbi:MAG: hypothetical protein DMD80_13945 [Candidatus Rokuibacteriota bacterium]|nr:MAG: hypothetical protein DMD80_13945 [Candidatus Rokubacteria bacterium]